MFSRISSERGQSTVEAALLLPVFLLIVGLLVQPAILLYNRCVMEAAASEGCRMLATSTCDEKVAKAYVERKLKAIPNAELFHMGSSWDIEVQGSEGSSEVSVSITNTSRCLPIVGIASGLVGQLNADGSVECTVEAASNATPDWVASLEDGPEEWIAQWD